ncbi:MAG: 30S ribosomal protein S3 [Candidatus Margulisiibacteriota bacterium]|nr:ribosomal protein S3 [uncultured bacterium]OGH99632.1 MAG: 30S ribosomal protein S3 [Candidatus Margulisbacteria bacterium GWD2_39_127]OGI04635.1 MAG: 30S ribosomal protein S3 [Candidatus Margulisbacteria bacterium GWF2_38_17]OGI11833.1 MAG: 30S ribosomal protein S3 [Candidatus Margulisbacteria bacterium GWE2_39_32]PZM79795.1 MAG: 30S ribosomal protein S3 [Candidatus Margulisiibacteriota bacterium]
MGQKVNPVGIRLGINKEWDSVWYADKKYNKLILEDYTIREFIKKHLKKAGIASIRIKRRAKQVEIDIYCARPGLIIGKGGQESSKIKDQIEAKIQQKVALNIKEQEKAELNAALLSQSLTIQLERRVAFRRAMKQIVNVALNAGALGIKVCCSGRLAGAEIARREWYREGRVPLQTFRADIDYALAEAHTVYGKIGVKVWVYKGDIIKEKGKVEEVLIEEAI